MTEPPARVVLIDSGVDPGHPGVIDRLELANGVRVTTDGEIVDEPKARDALGHGTAVAATMVAHTGTIPMTSVRVFENEPRCSPAQLLAALEFARSQAPAIINVSLGLLDDAAVEPLTVVVASLRHQGCRVVAPATANGVPCLPGSLATVDCVVADPNQPRGAPRLQAHGPRSIWFASPEPPPGLPGLPAAFVRGESLAVAEVTAHLWAQAQAQGPA